MVGHAGGRERGAEGLDEDLLVLARVPLGVGGVGELAGARVPRVPAGDVGGDAAELRRVAGRLVHRRELLRAGLEVVVPAEPAALSFTHNVSPRASPGRRETTTRLTVARIEILHHVGQVQGGEGVRDALTVAVGAVLARLEVDVGDEVGERVGLDQERERHVRLALDDLGNGYNTPSEPYK